MKKHLHLAGDGDIFPYCCNFDMCNMDMCKSMKLPKGHSLCTTTIENKIKEAEKLQQKPNTGNVEIIAAIPNSNSNQVKIIYFPYVSMYVYIFIDLFLRSLNR